MLLLAAAGALELAVDMDMVNKWFEDGDLIRLLMSKALTIMMFIRRLGGGLVALAQALPLTIYKTDHDSIRWPMD